MAQNDVVDLDKAIEEITVSELFPKPEAIIDKPYSGRRIGDNFKNLLVEDLGVPPNLIDLAVGRPGGFRERFFNPSTKPFDPLGFPPMSGVQIRGLRELFDPTDISTRMAQEAGVQTDGTPPRS